MHQCVPWLLILVDMPLFYLSLQLFDWNKIIHSFKLLWSPNSVSGTMVNVRPTAEQSELNVLHVQGLIRRAYPFPCHEFTPLVFLVRTQRWTIGLDRLAGIVMANSQTSYIDYSFFRSYIVNQRSERMAWEWVADVLILEHARHWTRITTAVGRNVHHCATDAIRTSQKFEWMNDFISVKQLQWQIKIKACRPK